MRSGTKWLPEDLVFYVDHCLGRRYVPEALMHAGARVIVHADQFPIDHPARAWLRECGRNGWVVLTKDGRFLPGTLEHDVIVAPERYAGQKVFGGFTGWARETLDDDAFEHSFLLQRGFLVALSRRFDEDVLPPGPASQYPMRPDSCYSYSTLHSSRAWRVPGNRRDFTDAGNEALLRWFDPAAPA